MKISILKDLRSGKTFEEFVSSHIGNSDCLKLDDKQRDDCLDKNLPEAELCSPCRTYVRLMRVYYA